MTWRRPHWRERPSHPEDDLRPHEGNKSAHAYQFALARMPRTGMEDERFFHQQANWCYQLAWQCFDLAVAHELNLMGNELTAKGRELWSQERKARQTQKLVDPRSDDKVATDKT